jgi:hypothetical protein
MTVTMTVLFSGILTLCSVLETYQRFGGTYFVLSVLKVRAFGSSKTFIIS